MRAFHTIKSLVILAALFGSPLQSGCASSPPDPPAWEEDLDDPVYGGFLLYENPLVRLHGKAKGGTIELVEMDKRMERTRHVVETKPGESGEEVTARIRQALIDSNEFGAPGAEDEGRRSNLFRALYGLGGTETGFGTTPVPRGLTGFVDWQSKCVLWRWRNAPGYQLLVAPCASQTSLCLAGDAEFGRAMLYSAESPGMLDAGHMFVAVSAYQDWRPSAPAHIEIDRCTFRESADPPHVLGLHPNWQRVELPGNAPPALERGPKPKPEPFRSAIPRPGEDAPPMATYEYFQARDRESVARREAERAEAARKAESARIRKSRGSMLDDPDQDKSYQSLRLPSGVAAIYRPVLVSPADRHEVGLRLKFALPGVSIERAPARVRLLAHVGAAYSVDEAVRKFVAAGASADPAAFGLTEFATLGGNSLPADWTDYTSHAKFGDEGIVIPGGAEEMSLVVLAEDLGDIELGIDWFWCRKLNCSDEIPEGWDPYAIVPETPGG